MRHVLSASAGFPGPHFRPIALLLLVAVLAQGCATGGGARRVGGDGLSAAAAEAKKDPDKKRKVIWAGDVVEEDCCESGWIDVAIDVASPPEPIEPYETEETFEEPDFAPPPSMYNRFHVGVVGGFGMPSSRDFGGHSLAGLQFGFFPLERTRLDAALLRNGANFSYTSGLRESFKHEYEFALDLSGRYYLTPEHASVGVYPIAGVQLGVLNWNYANPIVVEDYGLETVTSDYMTYVSPYVGLGTSLVQTRHFHFGLQLLGGMRVFDTHTGEGLANDLFPNDGFWQLRVEMTAPF